MQICSSCLLFFLVSAYNVYFPCVNHHHTSVLYNSFDKNLSGLGIARWNKPKGGYFISLYVLPGCAKRVDELCSQAGLILTPAGAAFPYGIDPEDSNLRIAPTYPSADEVKEAADLLTVAVRYAALEKLIN